MRNKLASLEATLVRNYDSLTDLLTYLLTRVKSRATSVAKKKACEIKVNEMINDSYQS